MSGRLHRVSLIALGICIGLLIAAVSVFAVNQTALADLFGPGLVRAQVVLYANGTDSEIWLDRGKISTLSGTGMMIREKDGQLQHVDVAPGARITLNGSSVALTSLRRGMSVQVFRPGDAPANRVDASTK